MIGRGKRQCAGKISASSNCSPQLVWVSPKKTTKDGGGRGETRGRAKREGGREAGEAKEERKEEDGKLSGDLSVFVELTLVGESLLRPRPGRSSCQLFTHRVAGKENVECVGAAQV